MANEDKLREYLKKAAADLVGYRERVQELERRTGEPVAIVSMACRYPGGINSPRGLWDLITAERDVMGAFPTDRGWDISGVEGLPAGFEPVGSFLLGAADFDPEFFDISPREAAAMDPQQRHLLEIAWETFEHGYLDAATLRGSRTGVFAGQMYSEYGSDPRTIDESARAFLGTGRATSVLSGRLSYVFGLEGPAITIDTACSSSLVALHLAVQALRNDECDLALAGGVTVMVTPDPVLDFARQGNLGAGGRCKAFAEAADGTGLGEGAGVLLLERLSDAQRHGHQILAVVRGSAVNQDGASNGLTAPNGPSQQRVIRAALTNAGLPAAAVDAVEAHGTGTALGDPIEAQALIATYGRAKEPSAPLWLGSVKSNIGHTQGAAGVAGVIKMVEAMRHGVLPATLHVDEPSRQVDWTAGTVELLTRARPWPSTLQPRRSAISSFGISGTNAHVILEQAPVDAPATGTDQPADADEAPAGEPADTGLTGGWAPWLLSARTPAALRDQAARLLASLDADPQDEQTGIPDIARTLLSRSRFEHQAVVFGTDLVARRAGLAALAAGTPSLGTATGTALQGSLGVLFTGQGSQYPGMGRELHRCLPAFAAAFDEVCAAFTGLLTRPLREIVFSSTDSVDAALLDSTEYTQPALFALETALYRLVTGWGPTPRYLAGHSLGEITAAHVAGMLSLPDAATLVAHRARLMQALPAGGAMLAVALDEAEARTHLVEGVDVAAVNAPGAVVLSGAAAAIDEVAAVLAGQSIRHKRLVVSHAFHSTLMTPMLADFEAVVRGLTFAPPRIDIISTVTGTQIGINEMRNPLYWVRQISAPVRFAQAVGTMSGSGVSTFLEIGPDAVLTAMAAQCLDGLAGTPGKQPVVVPALRRDRPEMATLTTAIGQLAISGRGVELGQLFQGGRPVPLPTYAFQRRRFWLQSAGGADVGNAGMTGLSHPLLAAVVTLADTGAVVLSGRISHSGAPWLADHRIAGSAVLPGAAIAEMVAQAGACVDYRRISELTLLRPLIVGDSAVDVQLTVSTVAGNGTRSVSMHARTAAGTESAGDWTLQATALLAPGEPGADIDGNWDTAEAVALDVGALHEGLAAAGIAYGPAFTGLRRAWRSPDGQLLAELELPESVPSQGFLLHPALLDAALQTVGLDGRDPGLPFALTGVHLVGSNSPTLRVRVRQRGGATAVTLSDPTGMVVGSIENVSSRPLTAADATAAQAAAVGSALFEVQWIPAAAAVAAAGQVLLLEPGAALPTDPDAAVLAVPCLPAAGADPAAQSLPRTAALLELLQAFLSTPAHDALTLVLLTRGAVGVDPLHPPQDLAGAALLGLARTAQTENPGRIVLIDSDEDLDVAGIAAALAAAMGGTEQQVAVRGGTVLVPRLRPARDLADTSVEGWDRDGTVVITGGTGALGAQVARHLAVRHHVGSLLLLSRRGPDAPGAAELQAELTGLGAAVTIAACDVGDETALSELLLQVPATHPVRGIVHAAGVLDDTPVTTMTSAQLGAVMTAKIDAGWALHRVTADLPLRQFVLFSSSAGVMGGAGQGNYAAANAFLDALSQYRRGQQLPATALSWGLWDSASGMAGALTAQDRRRLAVSGVTPLTVERGLALLDVSVASGRAHLVPIALTLPRGADPAAVPSLLHELIPAAAAGSAPATAVPAAAHRTLHTARPARRAALALALVQQAAAAVVGQSGRESVDPDRSFTELGLNSLTAIELRNNVAAATGLTLPPTLVFDHPSCRAVAELVCSLLATADDDQHGTAPAPAASASAGTDEVDPIVIVGMACRFPGEVDTPEALWDLVSTGADAISEFPTDRGWDLANLYHPDPDHPGTSYTRHGGFLHGAGRFDAAFFGISPREALAMDAQQRLLLETSWEAMESAGIDPRSLRGTRTGVFAGAMYHDYGSGLVDVPAGVEGFLGTGTAGSVVAGRISYVFGLEGPALTVDTACSSSLVALHSAVLALQAGNCDYALAGGVAVMATPASFLDFSRQRGLAADGRCKPFAAAADGTAWGEGAGMLLVERASQAARLGHRVLAVVRGSAVNQDGASNGLTAPNGPSQQRVIRAALAAAGLDAADVDVVEAHGTGTSLGDPIEAQALLATYGQRPADRPVLVGSLKANIGHTQAAAGVGGIIKMVQAMSHGTVPALLHLDAPSPQVDWTAGALRLVDTATPWEPAAAESPRRCAVSSFGFSGTNAHVILEAPAAVPATAATDPATGSGSAGPRTDPAADDGGHPWVLSGRTAGALRGQAAVLLRSLESGAVTGSDLDVAHTLAGRTRFAHRAVVLGHTPADRRLNLGLLSAGRDTAGTVTGTAGSGVLGMVFTGQGAQRIDMGHALYEAFPVYRAAFDEVCAAFDGLLDQPLADVVFAAPGSAYAGLLDRTEYTQPALFALETSLYRLLESFGVTAGVLAGHSIGEVAAAHVAGVFDLPGAATLVAARGRLMQALPAGGAMVAVEATQEQVADLLVDGVDLAAVNSPTSLVLSGVLDKLHATAKLLAGRGHRVKRLVVSHAFHSELMEPMLADFAAAISGIEMSDPLVPLISGMTGRPAADGVVSDPAYWVEHVRATVRFADATTEMAGTASTIVEVGPGAVLTAMAAQTLGSAPVRLIAALRGEQGERESFIAALAGLEASGQQVDWRVADPGGSPVALPTYAFQRKNYWLPAGSGAAHRTAPEEAFWAAVDAADSSTLSAELMLSDEAAAGLAVLMPELLRWRAERADPVSRVDPVLDEEDDESGPSLASQLANLSPQEQLDIVCGLVMSQTATVLGHADSADLEPGQDLLDLGFNSLTAVELRNRLEIITSLELPAALVYEFSSARDIAEFVLGQLNVLLPI